MTNGEKLEERSNRPFNTDITEAEGKIPAGAKDLSSNLFQITERYHPSENLRYLLFTGAFAFSALDTSKTVEQILSPNGSFAPNTSQLLSLAFAVSAAPVWATISLEKLQQVINRYF